MSDLRDGDSSSTSVDAGGESGSEAVETSDANTELCSNEASRELCDFRGGASEYETELMSSSRENPAQNAERQKAFSYGEKTDGAVEGGTAKESEISSKHELPACFDKMSDESKAKQVEALGKMSADEKNSYFDIIEREPAITNDVKNVAEKNMAELQGLEYRVKTPSSTYEKMYDRGSGEHVDVQEMNDVIRYTAVYSPDELADGTNACLSDFESRGYTVDRVKNTWDNENATYRGINAVLTNPEGQSFEVQFHTQESFDLKNGELHALYEQRRTMADDNPKAIELDEKMAELSSKMERPKGIEKVRNR